MADLQKEQYIDNLLKNMSIAEKAGQMTQLSIDMLSMGEPYSLKEPHQFDKDKLKEVLIDLKVGSILNAGGHAYTVERWHQIMDTIQHFANDLGQSDIPVLYGIDAIHGTTYTLGGTLFPQQLGQASSWNTELAKTCGQVTAYETRASGIPWTFAPVLDIGRDARWPRLWETFGEDTYLASALGVSFIEGCQGDNIAGQHNIASCMKHFLGYSFPVNGRDRTTSVIAERQLRTFFIPTFQAAINAGAKTIMINSGDVNGIPVHSNDKILKDLLRDELGFKGVALTDWQDIEYLVSRHRIAKDYKDAIKIAINAGIDLAMVPMDTKFTILLTELINEGEVSQSRVDEAVKRILALKMDLGLFENYNYYEGKYDLFGSQEHIAKAKKAADESVILLKNANDILPLSMTSSVFVTGPNADNLMALNGGWTGTWQGNDPKYLDQSKLTVKEAITNKSSQVVSDMSMADVIIYVGGESSYTEKPGDLEDLRLAESQQQEIKELTDSGKKVILVLVQGRPRIINEIVSLCDGIITAFLPGNEGGRAIADVIYGEVNPSGKLPITYPSNVNDLLCYDHYWTDEYDKNFGWNGFNPQFEFGFGLSYTNFDYSDLSVTEGGEGFNVEISVSNTGARKGAEVVQLFISDKVASVAPAVKKLRGFHKITLEPGESKKISFQLGEEDFKFVGRENTWVLEPGEFDIMVGDQKSPLELVEGKF